MFGETFSCIWKPDDCIVLLPFCCATLYATFSVASLLTVVFYFGLSSLSYICIYVYIYFFFFWLASYASGTSFTAICAQALRALSFIVVAVGSSSVQQLSGWHAIGVFVFCCHTPVFPFALFLVFFAQH